MTRIATRPKNPQQAARFPGTESDLQALRAELEQQRRFRFEQLSDLNSSTPIAGPTWADDPQSSVALALKAAATTVLINIDDALLRIKRNRYGLCQGCGSAIPLERLQALPSMRWCGHCQHAHEATNGNAVETHPPRDTHAVRDIVDEWGYGSFPASDPPANW